MERLRMMQRPVAALAVLSLFAVALAVALIALIVLSRDGGGCLGFDLQPLPCEQVIGPGAASTG